MLEFYTRADLKAATKATRRIKGGTIVGILVEEEVQRALDKVAPAIAARAQADVLRKMANEIAGSDALPLGRTQTREWLRGWADEIERGAN